MESDNSALRRVVECHEGDQDTNALLCAAVLNALHLAGLDARMARVQPPRGYDGAP